MAGDGTGPGISRPLSPNRDAPTVIGHLLQRKASANKTSKRFHRRSIGSAAALKEQLLTKGNESPLPAARQKPRSTAPNAGDMTQPQPQQTRAKPTAPTATLEMPSAAQPPQLKKRPSLRERLKAWQKPPQHLELVAEEPKPRFVYEPKHAAADFSRLVVSPVSPSRPRLASPAEARGEGDSAFARRSSQGRARQRQEDRVRSPREPDTRYFDFEPNRHSHSFAEDHFEDANTAAHIPLNTRPMACNLGAHSGTHEEQSPTQPLSDYELFILRAEAEERERREQVLRSISQRSAAYSTTRVKPDPHRQFVAVASSSSAERTAGQRPLRQHSGSGSGGRYVLGSGNGSGFDQERQREHQRQGNGGTKGHASQSSWAPSYATSGSGAAERVLERRKTPVPQHQPQHTQQQATVQATPRRPPEPAAPARFSVEEVFGNSHEREYQPQPPRTLRRQASLTQRIAQYIRPPKTGVVHRVETLVE